MNISSLCHRDIVSISGSASVRQAAEAMRSHHVGALVVTDPEEPGRAVGVVTDRDLVVGVLAAGLPLEGQAVGKLCSSNLVGIPATATIAEAVEAMRRAGVRRLVVLEPGGCLLGLLSADDVFEAIAGELDVLSAALRSGIARENLRTAPDAPAFELPQAVYLPGYLP